MIQDRTRKLTVSESVVGKTEFWADFMNSYHTENGETLAHYCTCFRSKEIIPNDFEYEFLIVTTERPFLVSRQRDRTWL